jgi:tetratricopeptide (TPR) repeat protein
MLAALMLAGALAGAGCGRLLDSEAGGDYTNPADRERLQLVESFHFTADVENLKRGASDKLGGDIGYTLEHFPNHHRALAAMARLGLRDKAAKVAGAHYTVVCYFERALHFSPDDAVVRATYGGYLLAAGSAEAALEQMLEAARLAPDDAANHYNLGLLYAGQKNYSQARVQARLAYRLGFPLPGLKNRLRAAHQWDGFTP